MKVIGVCEAELSKSRPVAVAGNQMLAKEGSLQGN